MIIRLMNRNIKIQNPNKLLPWISGPYIATGILLGVILLLGFTPRLLFVNYFFEMLFLVLFIISCKNKYKCYKEEPDLKITKYFWLEIIIHSSFIVVAIIQSALNIWIDINDSGLIYKHNFLFISLMILVLHFTYTCIDYYVTEKAYIVKYCNKFKKTNKENNG